MLYSRRKFLSTTTVAGSALAISSQLAFSNIKEYALGIQLYTFRDQMQSNPLKTLEEIASLGIKKIESNFFCSFLDKVDRFKKFNILRPNQNFFFFLN